MLARQARLRTVWCVVRRVSGRSKLFEQLPPLHVSTSEVVHVTLAKSGERKAFAKGTTSLQVANTVVPKHRFLLARVDDTLQSLHEPLERDCRVQFLAYNDDSAAQRCLAHSAAHTLGHALETLFDGAQLVDGPALDEHSFYYDCVLPAGRTVHANDLAPLEREMRALISSGAPFELRRATPDEARRLFADNRHKLHMIEQLASAGAAISVYRCGDFVDLCRGPHVPSLASIRSDAVHLYRVGGTHNANEHRVTGAVFAHRKLLRAWQEAREVAAQRDHRRIGTQQELFMFSAHSPGSVFLLPNGARIRRALVCELRREYRRRGFDEVATPQMFDAALWEQSGHWEHYRNDMFVVHACSHGTEHQHSPPTQPEPKHTVPQLLPHEEHRPMYLKPMNCPSHCLMFGRKVHSHRELPVRYADFGALHRNELSGALSGLTRLRRFCQDDAHIFCMPEQVESEVTSNLEFLISFYAKLGFPRDSVQFGLSTRPEVDQTLGDDDMWSRAEAALRRALDTLEIDAVEYKGEGAFYGPKIDVSLKDAADRWHQCGTIQLDFNSPVRFDLKYQSSESEELHVVMIHRAVCGSLERMLGVLAEHHAGVWPLWLAPVRAAIIPVGEAQHAYAARVRQQLMDGHTDEADDVLPNNDGATYIVETDDGGESVAKRVRNAITHAVPYVLVVGHEEESSGTVSVRRRGSADTQRMSIGDLLREWARRLRAFE